MNQPWIEKYRPNKIENIVLNETNQKIINNMIKQDNYPNMLFYGPPGTGKTTTILCLVEEYQTKHNCKNNYIHLNASHERGVDVIRNQIAHFTNNTTCEKKEVERALECNLKDLRFEISKEIESYYYSVIQNMITTCNLPTGYTKEDIWA